MLPVLPTPAVAYDDTINVENSGALQVFRKEEPLNPVRTGIPEGFFDTFNPSSALIHPYYAANIPSGDEDYRSNVDRFVARLFHRVVMRDTTAGDRPVESYELASAGVTGLNKLFGWEMALHKNTGDKGEIRSYYFTSKLLKFNAPVRKPADEL